MGWVRNDKLIWCFPKCWFVFVIVIYIRPKKKKTEKWSERFTHVINNKIDGDSKPTMPYFNNTTDDLLWFFQAKWQVMEHKRRIFKLVKTPFFPSLESLNDPDTFLIYLLDI